MPAYAGGERKGLAADGHVALAGAGGKMSGSYARCAGVRECLADDVAHDAARADGDAERDARGGGQPLRERRVGGEVATRWRRGGGGVDGSRSRAKIKILLIPCSVYCV